MAGASNPPTAARGYTRKRQRTRANLIAAATKVLARHGVDGATIGDIAAEAGVVPGTIYHHFGNRDALIAESLSGLASVMDDGVAQARAAVDDPATRLALAAAGLLERALADRLFASAFGRLARRVPALRDRLRGDIAEVIADGVESGRFRLPTANVALVADALLGVATAAAVNAAAGEASRDDRPAVAHLVLVMLGLDAVEAERVATEACAIIDGVHPVGSTMV
jgi:AcrR family transcriptional regulator